MTVKKSAAVFYSLPFLFILLAFYFPLANLLISGVSPSSLINIFSESYFKSVFIFTLKQAFFSTFFSMIPGLIGAYILVNFNFPFKNIIKSITLVPFVLPSIIVVLGFVLLFGNNGLINSAAMKLFNLEKPPFLILYSFKAIILAHVFYNSPLFIRIVSSAWERISGDIIEAAESLGAAKLRVFMTAVLPQILPPVIAAFSLIFILCFMSFSIILVLGGGPKFTTLEVEIYRLVRISMDIKAACSLSVLQSFVTLSFLFIYSFYQKKTSMIYSDNFRTPEKQRSSSLLQKILIVLFFLFLFIIIIMPLAMIIFESFRFKSSHAGNAVFSLRWYIKSFSELGFRPVKNSLILASFNTLLTCAVSVAALSYLQRKKTVMKVLIETFFAMSLGVSSIILSLSYMKAVSDFQIEIQPLVLLSMLHSVIFLPLVFKSISVFYDKIDRSIIESAESIGADRRRILFTIELPLVRGGIITGGVLAFALSMGEINSTLMIAPERFTTIPVAIYRLIGSYNFSQACAMGSILIVTCVISFFLIDKSGRIEL